MSELVRLEKVSRRFAQPAGLTRRLAVAAGLSQPPSVVRAVSDVDLTIRAGEALGLVGESGCGKSTLGRIIAGILPPSEGRAMLDGARVMGEGRRPVKTTTRVQMIFQDPFASLDPRWKIGAAISEGPIAHGLVAPSEARAFVVGWLQAVGLPPDVADRYPHQFSGGQRQRVAIARALAMKPDVLVCDEPVASLDVSIQAQIINLFLTLRRELDLTLLFISHDLGVVRHVCDRIAIMYLGRIVEMGPTQVVMSAPLHPYARALLDSIPRLALEGDEAAFRPIAGELPSPLAPPPGCHFHVRCRRAAESCIRQSPLLTPRGPSRSVACHFPIEE
ncbi:MAG: ATP-binding cassette domain-containing protein [Methylobacteriaceae bacterium]|nr:ATP-binding cassette domain-containing protein [Methylobacteriaceae bacterium]